MDVPVTEAKARLTDLIRRAEAGEDVVVTRHGEPIVRLSLVKSRRKRSSEEMMAAIDAIVAISSKKALRGPCAARSQDFLYGDDGLPG